MFCLFISLFQSVYMNLCHLPGTFLKEVRRETGDYLDMFLIFYFFFLRPFPFLPLASNHQQNLKRRGWRKGEKKRARKEKRMEET